MPTRDLTKCPMLECFIYFTILRWIFLPDPETENGRLDTMNIYECVNLADEYTLLITCMGAICLWTKLNIVLCVIIIIHANMGTNY